MFSRPLPIGPSDKPLKLSPRRHKGLPTIYQTPSHPKRRSAFGRILYYVQDTTEAGLKAAAELEDALSIPEGSEADAIALGYLKLEEDDILFVRAISAPSTGDEDVACCWVTGGRIFTQTQKDKMLAVRELALGDRALRSRTAPIKTGRQYVGGTAFERNSRADPVHENTRCYSIGHSYENHTKLMAPCKDNKVLGDENDEALAIRSALLQAGSPLAMASMKEGPDEVFEHIKINAELINAPSMGDDSNVCQGGGQINMAPAEPYRSATTLRKAMGFFGGKHRDKKDNAAYYTHMCSLSDLPEGYDPGRFFILFPGVFITLSNFACINFSGLRMHGGTPPRAPPNADPSALEWATRFCLIHYPPNGQTSGQQRYVLGGLPDNSPFMVAPEMTQAVPLTRADRGWCSHAAYLEDGSVLQQRKGHFNFIVRALYCVCLYFILQLPTTYNVKIDLDQFIRSFTIEDVDGSRVPADIWTLGPGHRRRHNGDPENGTNDGTSSSSSVIDDNEFVDQEELRSEMRDKWSRFYNHVAAHIPYAVIKTNGVLPLQPANDDQALQQPANDQASQQPTPNLPQGGRPAVAQSKKPKTKTKARSAADVSGQDTRKLKRRRTLISQDQSDDEIDDRVVPELLSKDLTISALDVSRLQDMLQVQDTSSSGLSNVRRSARLRRAEDFSIGKQWSTPGTVLEDPGDLSTSDDDLEDGGTLAAIRRQPDNTPTFLAAITSNLIQAEYSIVRTSITAAIASGNDPRECSPAQSLETLMTCFTSSPSSCSMPVAVSQGWAGLRRLEQQNEQTSLLLRKERAVIMAISHSMWYWLDVHIAQKASEILAGTLTIGTDLSWLTELVLEVKSMYELRLLCRTFRATQYGLQLPNSFHEVQLTNPWPRTTERQESRIVSTVVEILQHWLQFPSHPNARPQAWFIHVILTQFGHHLLYLDYIWTTYTNVYQNLFIKGSWRLASFACVQPVIEAAPHHPLFIAHSEESRMLRHMAQLLNQYFSGELTVRPAITDGSQDDGQVFSARLPTILQTIASDRESCFTSFLTDAMHLTLSTPTYTPRNPNLREIFLKIPDKIIPFREAAPGRQRFQGADGPFTPTVIRTKRGIFSALVWRGITFSTEFSRLGPMLFNSADHFNSVRNSLYPGRPDKFFCDVAAYGTPNPSRKVDLAHDYWEALSDDSWTTFIGSSEVGFRDCYAFFRQHIPGVGPKFPQLGPLGSYLLTADLVYAGVVSMPSIDDMAWLVREINKGAAAALEDLGLIEPRASEKGYLKKPDLSACRRALQHVFQILLRTIPVDRQNELCIDYIALEHTLCKFSRATQKNWLANSKG